jgi:ferritin
MPNEQIYNDQAKYFKYRDFNGAADFIIDYLFKDIP